MVGERQSCALRGGEAAEVPQAWWEWKQKAAAGQELNPLHLPVTPAASQSPAAECCHILPACVSQQKVCTASGQSLVLA